MSMLSASASAPTPRIDIVETGNESYGFQSASMGMLDDTVYTENK